MVGAVWNLLGEVAPMWCKLQKQRSHRRERPTLLVTRVATGAHDICFWLRQYMNTCLYESGGGAVPLKEGRGGGQESFTNCTGESLQGQGESWREVGLCPSEDI